MGHRLVALSIVGTLGLALLFGCGDDSTNDTGGNAGSTAQGANGGEGPGGHGTGGDATGGMGGQGASPPSSPGCPSGTEIDPDIAGAGSDGKDLGADMPALAAATMGVAN